MKEYEFIFKHWGKTFTYRQNSQPTDIKYIIDGTGCYICISHVATSKGYTRIYRKGKAYGLHRLVYSDTHLLGRNIPKGLHVCHRCDNPGCFNPSHLFLGTNEDNMKDKARKGRVISPFKVGSANVMAKLTERQVIEIRNNKSVSSYKMAKLHGVTDAYIRSIRTGITWKHILPIEFH